MFQLAETQNDTFPCRGYLASIWVFNYRVLDYSELVNFHKQIIIWRCLRFLANLNNYFPVYDMIYSPLPYSLGKRK